MILQYFKETLYYEKALGRLKIFIENPEENIIKVIIKHIGKILNTITYEGLANDIELAVMIQTLLLVTAQNHLEEESVHLAKNLPSIIFAYGPENFVEELLPALDELMALPSGSNAKQILASIFHEVINITYEILYYR